MAIQDSGHILADATLTSTANADIVIQITVSMAGSLDASASGTAVSETFVSMAGTGSMSVTPKLYKESGLIQMSGSLNGTATNQVLVNTYVTMYGFLNSNINLYKSVHCADLAISFETQMIESLGCSIGESVELKRYRGDTYPVSTTLSKNGSYDATGITFEMSTQIGGGTIYTVAGIIDDANNGLVSFPLGATSVSLSGTGVYDIQGNDGTYIYTYEKGVFTLLDDVTV